MGKYVIGIDLVTQSLKGFLVDPQGKIVAESSHAHDYTAPHPNWAESKVSDYIVSLTSVINDLVAKSGIDPEDIGTIGMDAINDSVIAADADGNALGDLCVIWMDRRAEAITDRIKANVDEGHVFDVTGLNLDSTHTAAKMLWIKEERPDLYEKAKYIMNVDSYMVYWMTGVAAVDYAQASASMLYNVAKMDWDPEMCELFGLDPALLGTLQKAENVVGTLKPDIAQRLHLTTKTKVIVGTGDEHSSCLGSGLVKSGMVCDITGTAEPGAATFNKPVFDTKGLVETHHSADSGLWLIENPGFVSGGSTRWFIDNILRKPGYKEMNEIAMGDTSFLGKVDPEAKETLVNYIAPKNVAIGSNGLTFLPCMGGAMTPTWNGKARGTFIGLTLSHGVGEMARAVFEGITFGLKDNVDRFAELGIDADTVRIVGGATKSPFWCQMKADALGKRLEATKSSEGAAIGAAMLASVAEGNFANLEEAAEAMVELGAIYEPDFSKKAEYDEAYARYLECYTTLEPFFNKYYKA